MAVAIYCRVSTEEQRERQSILTQREFGERYSALHKLTVHHLYSDDGVSGTVPLELRPEGSEVLRDARAGKFDQLLIYKLDRLGRETRLILNSVAELEKLGVRVRSMTEEFDTASATGRLMLTMLSGFATHEREVIRERSVAGTFRAAESGIWMGGIVPYGYRKTGEKRDARIVISEDPIPGMAMSEVDVIRDVFRMAAVERKSCYVIAVKLNELGVPCAYVRDDRVVLRGKRKGRTAGVWRPGRVRGLLRNRTYMGIHEFGKRTASGRPVIRRPVPAIVNEAIWNKAQKTLDSHQLISKAGPKNEYLLRGLIKCGVCGLTYVGTAANRPNGKREFYYRCNGAHSRMLFRSSNCKSKSVRGDHLEAQVWSDVEAFLRNPRPILEQLHAKLQSDSQDSEGVGKQIDRLQELIADKANERNRVLGLFRRGRLNEKALDEQMDEIGKEETALERQLEELRGKVTRADSIVGSVKSAESLLAKLRKRLDEPVSWELRRQLVEILVAGIQVETLESYGVKQARVTVSYRFSQQDQLIPVVLPQSFSPTGIRIPIEPKTIGDHIRRRRLSLKLHHVHVAERVGVDKCCINNWEGNYSTPAVKYMPAIIEFLGYNPLPEPKDVADRLVRHRMTLGLTQRESAAHVGVDQGTLARWERGEREPTGAFLERVKRFLAHSMLKRDLRRAG